MNSQESYSFATLFDINYLSRGLALRESMYRHIASFHFYVLCLDEPTYHFLLNENDLRTHPIKLIEIEEYFPELSIARNNRSWVEYLFTLSPFWPLYLLEKHTHIPQIITLDADIYFFSSPVPVLQKLSNKSVLITPHRFSKKNDYKATYGYYNVSFQSFKNNEIGIGCLKNWAASCLDWCYDKLEENRFADQKYLDAWPSQLGSELGVFDHIGIGAAPWNIDGLKVTNKRGQLMLNETPLVFYHYHHFRILSPNVIQSGLGSYQVLKTWNLMHYIYRPYLMALKGINTRLNQYADSIPRYHHTYDKKNLNNLIRSGVVDIFVFGQLLLGTHIKPY